MKKPRKSEVIAGIQFFLCVYTMTMGFFYTYAFWCWEAGLLVAWWVLLIAMVLALLSVFGLMQWIRNAIEED